MEKNNITAVEWLYQNLFPKQLDGFSEEEWKKIDTAFEQAKRMEKEQITDAFYEGDLYGTYNIPEQESYYDKIYGKK
jgi:hypothetical protein